MMTRLSEHSGGMTKGLSRFLILLLVSVLLSLSFSQAYGRRIKILKHHVGGHPSKSSLKESLGIGREMAAMVEMDYKDPGANTNPRGGGGPSWP